jgi:hypothetical protein
MGACGSRAPRENATDIPAARPISRNASAAPSPKRLPADDGLHGTFKRTVHVDMSSHLIPPPIEVETIVRKKCPEDWGIRHQQLARVALTWLKEALLNCHVDKRVKDEVTKLLQSQLFTCNLSYMGMYDELKKHCHEEGLKIGTKMDRYYVNNNLRHKLENLEVRLRCSQ